MDDREFLAELEHVEPGVAADESAHVGESTLEQLEEGLPLERPAYPREVTVQREVAPSPMPEPEWAGAATPSASDLSRNQVGWLLAGFLALLLAGGAGAALIFHERVADILALLR